MNNIITTINTETAEAMTPALRLTTDTGYSCQCGTCETEYYLTKPEWDGLMNGGGDIPCPVCVDGLPLPMTTEETAAREFLALVQETLSSLRVEAKQACSDAMRPSVRRALDTLRDALYTGEDAAFPYRKQ